MANIFVNALKASVPTTPFTLYTGPTDRKSVCHSIFMANKAADEVAVSVELTDISTGAVCLVANAVPVPINTTYYLDKPINIEEGDILKVWCDTAVSMDVTASILQVT
jgi:hypothetical protein